MHQSASLSESNQEQSLSEFEVSKSQQESDLQIAGDKSHCDEGFGEWSEWSACERIGEIYTRVILLGLIITCKAGISASK